MSESERFPFVVVGATGQQGGAVIDALLERGVPVRAVVRDRTAPASTALTRRGVTVSFGDQDDAASLVDAFRGAAALFVMTTYDQASGGTDAEARRGRTIAESAAAAGVPRVVYSSVGGAERHTGIPHFESKRRVEERLQELMPVTIVRPTFFMENLARALSGDEIVIRLPLPADIPLQMIAVRDIGVIAAEALLDPEVVPGGAIEIAGDQQTGDGIAAVMADVLGRPARFEALPLQVLEGDADRTAMFRWFINTPSYQADFDRTRRIDPDVRDLRSWLATTGTAEVSS
ncbi:NmrA/HSCARG family protein [Microbacterium enclense]|uniref:NmrA/HSCARG family protein n=1 Tax=Microbacterium enclense TaxID=993073 RepID=A0A3S4LTW5_9MICO|nr:NmrA/HSCARG family protein [Microbacterium enclense]RWR15777.1 NmrA/HSCARG family protein [Microbacterium enclense]